jgi:3-phosphoshikimate 1-carboxyvinyltransferase
VSATGPVWPAPLTRAPVDAVVRVPGSKSQTNRLLVLAALATGPSRLRMPLRARDTLLMAAGLRALGAAVRDDGADWVVEPAAAGPADTDPDTVPPAPVDCGNAGTVARFLPPAVGALAHPARFDGDPRMRERPIGPLLEALRGLGVQVEGDRMPFEVRGPGRGGSIPVDASRSSQLVSGLLLAAPHYRDGVEVRAVGPPPPSGPHLAMTVAELRAAGAVVTAPGERRWRVEPGPLHGQDRVVEPDLSAASAFLAAAAVTGGRVTLADWPEHTEQPGRQLPDLLTRFGCTCRATPAGLEVRGPGRLRGVDLDLHEYGEAVPTLTALAVLADGPTRLRGVAHLRDQETDRLAALAGELGRLGARIRVTDDGLAVQPARLRGARLDPHADHRLAMAYAVVGLVVPGVEVLDMATTGKTVPDFPARWTAMVGAG